MAHPSDHIANRIGSACRNVAVAVIAGVMRWRSISDLDAAIRQRPVQQQAMITAGVLGLLFGFSLFAAQFGWIGMLAFWLAVIILVN